MKNQQNFKLIDGIFSSEESKEILMSVYSSKIQFHERKNFSMQVRFGKEDATATARLPQLQKNLEEIIKLLEETEKKSFSLQIKADVSIKLIEA